MAYVQAKDENLRRKIYMSSVRSPLRQLIQAVIHRYKYYKTGMDLNTLVDDSEGFLLMQFPKMKPNKGKAFSYFTVVLRNYLTALSKKQTKGDRTMVDIENDWYVNDNAHASVKLEQSINDVEDGVENKDYKLFIEEVIETLRMNIAEGYPPHTPKDVAVYDALATVLQNYKIFEITNKKYFLYLMREITGMKTKAISGSIRKLGEQYADLKKYLFEI